MTNWSAAAIIALLAVATSGPEQASGMTDPASDPAPFVLYVVVITGSAQPYKTYAYIHSRWPTREACEQRLFRDDRLRVRHQGHMPYHSVSCDEAKWHPGRDWYRGTATHDPQGIVRRIDR